MGAICLARFCESQYLRDRCIDTFLKHLWKIATAESISAWERQGRGRELFAKVASLADRLEEPLRDDFLRLLERVIEVGKYGASDRLESRRSLAEAMEIVERYGVVPPEQALFEKSPPGMQGWGRPVRAELLRKWRELA